MNSYNKDTELNSHICEAAGCFTKAIVEIKVPLGNEGILTLNLCENCLPKFNEGKSCSNLEI